MQVTVYSTPTCPFCKKLKTFLNEQRIKFVDIDVAADDVKAKEMIAKTNQMGVPVIEIDGNCIVGFQEEKIRKALNLS